MNQLKNFIMKKKMDKKFKKAGRGQTLAGAPSGSSSPPKPSQQGYRPPPVSLSE
jgi:hypothetical protein